MKIRSQENFSSAKKAWENIVSQKSKEFKKMTIRKPIEFILTAGMILFSSLFADTGSVKQAQSTERPHLYQTKQRLMRQKKPKKGKSALQLYSPEALKQTMNYQSLYTGGPWEALPFTLEDVQSAALPPYLDWRELEGVTAIDIQPEDGCGGCWIYAATAVFESLIKINLGLEVDLSEEQISSCLRNGNHTGIAWQAFNFMQYNGVTTEEFIPCEYTFPRCNPSPPNSDMYYLHDHWIVAMWETPLPERVKIMKYAILNYGPVASGFIVYTDWGNYRSGVYLHDGVSPYGGHHSIAVVGWVDDESIPNGGYWIVKNDFGEEWGEDGFFRIGYGECEIDMTFMFAQWNPDTQDPIFAVKVGTRYFYVGEDIRLNISARVPEGNYPFYQAVNLPMGANYDSSTGLFTWTPTESQMGAHEIEFIAAYDNFSASQTGVIIIVPKR